MKILYIEDDPGVQPSMQRFFRINFPDAVVITAAEVAAATYVLEYDINEPAAIVSDFDIRGGTGADVLNWCYLHRPSLVSRFIFLTGKEQKHAAFEAITEDMRVKLLGHPHWLVKPAPMGPLRELIEKLTVQS